MSNEFDVEIEQHTTYTMTLSLTDASGGLLDVSDWTFSGSVKASYKDTTPIAVFGFNTGSAVSGSIQAYLTSEESGKLVKTTYYYDIVGINPNTNPIQVLRVIEGQVTVDLGVTDPVVED